MPTIPVSHAVNLDQWYAQGDGSIRGLDKNIPSGGGGGSSLFSENFNAPLADPWYGTAVSSGHLSATNAEDGTNCYLYQWLTGQSNYPLSQTARRQFVASEQVDITFDARIDTGAVLDPGNGDHCLYFKLSTHNQWIGPASGWAFYIQAEGDGQTEVEWKRSGDQWTNSFATAQHGRTVGAPSWLSGTFRTIRVYAEMNTIGASDGILKIWVDDTLYIDRADCYFRDSASELFGQLIIGPELKATQTETVGMYVDNLTLSNDVFGGGGGSSDEFDAVNYPYHFGKVYSGTIRYVDATHPSASNGNDGSESSPWLTIEHGLTNVGSNETLLICGNTTYTPSANFNTFGFTATNVTVAMRPGDTPIIDCINTFAWIELQSVQGWTFEYLRLDNFISGLYLGENAGANGCTFRSISGQTSRTGDNAGLVAMYGGNKDFLISRVMARNSTGGFTNTGGVYIDDPGGTGFTNPTYDPNTGVIEYCDLQGASFGIYFKHGTDTLTAHTANITVRYSIFNNNSRSAAGYNPSGVKFEHCLFGSDVRFPESDGGNAGDYNWIDHCTFAANLVFIQDSRSGDVLPGAQSNRITNSVVLGELIIESGDSSVTSDSNYNSYGNVRTLSGTPFSIAAWRTETGGEQNSIIEATPTAGSDWSLPSSYEVTGGAALGGAQDGSNRGANTDAVGVFGVAA